MPSPNLLLPVSWSYCPLSCYFSTKLLFFAKILCKPKSSSFPLSSSSLSTLIYVCDTHVIKILVFSSLANLSFVSLIYKSQANELKMNRGKFFSLSHCIYKIPLHHCIHTHTHTHTHICIPNDHHVLQNCAIKTTMILEENGV